MLVHLRPRLRFHVFPISESLRIQLFPKLTMTLRENIIAFSVNGVMVLPFQDYVFWGIVMISFGYILFRTGPLLIRLFQGVDRPVNTEALCIR